jgi:soluble lytic murein transglycosylase-like protein
MRTALPCLLLAACVLVTPATQAAGDGNVWSFEDSDGVAHFSNVPDNSPYRLYLKDPGSYRLKAEGNASTTVARTKASRPWTTRQDKLPFAEMVTAAASEHQLDPALLHAIIHVESRHNPAAISSKGAIGLMQLLPETARRMGIENASTPERNISAGARYMRFLLDIFGKDTELALAAYNAGENAVIRHGNRIPPYRETLAYVPAVIAAYDELRKKPRQ